MILSILCEERVAYIPCNDLIQLANDIFGPNGWSSSVTHLQQEFVRAPSLSPLERLTRGKKDFIFI
jgi:recombination DNA repair RAD52 pathway protein